MKSLKNLLKKNPQALSTFLSTSVNLLTVSLKPVKKFMEFLLEVQDIPLNTRPGTTQQKLMNMVFDKGIVKDAYEDDFDIGPATAGFRKLIGTKYENITKSQFHDLTDVEKLTNNPSKVSNAPLQVAVAPATDFQKRVLELKEFMEKNHINSSIIASEFDDKLKALKESVKDLKKNHLDHKNDRPTAVEAVKKMEKGSFRRIKRIGE